MNPSSSLFDPLFLAAVLSGLIMFGLLFYLWQARMEKRARTEVKKRLDINKNTHGNAKASASRSATAVASKLAKKTEKFYQKNDSGNQKKIQLRMIQAGFMNKSAIGYFLAARFILGTVGLTTGIMVAVLLYPDMSVPNKILVILILSLKGYFLPNIIIDRRIKNRQQLNREGFPDVMDLMIVSAEAGLTTEASIERIAEEIKRTYPILSEQLHFTAIEIRAGKPLDESLRAFGERLGLEEVQGFATMIQQSKELGTSISDALRIFGEEMRHKRMMMAEEKAYALPAKLSIPVTVFILPIVIFVAIIPTIVRYNM